MSPRLAAGLLLGLLAGAAPAQTLPASGFALQTFEPTPAGDGFFTVPAATTPGHLVPGAALVLAWAQEPLILKVNGQEVPGGHVVHRQFWAFAQGSLGLTSWLLLDLTVPVALYQSGSQYFPSLDQVSTAAVGDLKLGARAALGHLGPVAVAGALSAWVPSGNTGAFTSDGGVRLQPQVVGGWVHGDFEYGADLGLLYRENQQSLVGEVGTALTYGAAMAWRHGAWRVGPELYGRWQFEGVGGSPVEALLGGHWRGGPLEASLGVGTGFNQAVGASPFRLLARVSWRPQPPSGPTAEELARQAAERDAAAKAEADRLAAERAAAEAAAAQAAADAEAARLAALAAAAAAASADRDGDGVPDVSDACPDRPGPRSAEAARNGCPLPEPALVTLTREKIEILQAVKFETGKDVIQPESEPLLGQVAQVLNAHPELARVMVEGHTDSQGSKALNVTLSEKRARAVKRWLVERGGVDAARLTAEGYGPSRPVATNATKEGRALNRRVEFRIVEQRDAP